MTGLVVPKSKWNKSVLPIVCGISNAGGGSIIISTDNKNYTSGVRKLRKPLEEIPSVIRNALGINCLVEPTMQGISLCLEITIPKAPEPLKYMGKFYLYESYGNVEVTEDEVEAALAKESVRNEAPAPSEERPSAVTRAPATSNNKKALDFAEKSVAAANDIYLTLTDEYILKILRANGRATAAKIVGALGVSESTVRRSFRRLKDEGFIERIGSKKSGYWKVIR